MALPEPVSRIGDLLLGEVVPKEMEAWPGSPRVLDRRKQTPRPEVTATLHEMA